MDYRGYTPTGKFYIMKRLILGATLVLALSSCDHQPYFSHDCTNDVTDGYDTVPYMATGYRTVGSGKDRRTKSYQYMSFHSVRRHHCANWVNTCHPGKIDGKVIPCGTNSASY